MKTHFYIALISMLAASMPLGNFAVGQDCHYLSKILVNSWANFTSYTYFNDYYPDETWDYLCDVDSIAYKLYNGLNNSIKLTITRNGNGDILDLVQYDSLSPSVRNIFDWDYNSKTLSQITEYYIGAAWEVSEKYEIDYHDNGAPKQVRSFYWDGSQWVPEDVDFYEIDGQGNLTTVTYTDGLQATGFDGMEYTYDANGNILSIIFSDKDQPADPWEPYEKRSYAYNTNGVKIQTIYSDWDNNQWCENAKLDFPIQNNLPTSVLYSGLLTDCGLWGSQMTATNYTWDIPNRRLLEADFPLDNNQYRMKLYYNGMTSQVGEEVRKNLAFQVINPIQPGQAIAINGLSGNRTYQYSWMGVDGRTYAQGEIDKGSFHQIVAPSVSAGIYFLWLRDVGTGLFGAQKVVLTGL
ncbi:MAG: RHS repeat protein [Lewinellaceae bacterium]|nr:RHS repeat protein [Saprospiraceae bacterium]MCB9340377.1 RHS repeat protein [Lewinellaceae bacterium]